jgi:hypothetical protein
MYHWRLPRNGSSTVRSAWPSLRNGHIANQRIVAVARATPVMVGLVVIQCEKVMLTLRKAANRRTERIWHVFYLRVLLL